MTEKPKGDLAQERLAELRRLKEEFGKAHGLAVTSADTAEALKLKGEIERGIANLRDSIVSPTIDVTEINKIVNSFMVVELQIGNAPQFPNTRGQKVEVKPPTSINYVQKSRDVDGALFGEKTFNPYTQGLDLGSCKAKLLKAPTMLLGQPVGIVADYVAQLGDIRLLGAEYWVWACDEEGEAKRQRRPSRIPQELKVATGPLHKYFLFGSIVRDMAGRWAVPCIYWNGERFRPSWEPLDATWDQSYRIILLDK